MHYVGSKGICHESGNGLGPPGDMAAVGMRLCSHNGHGLNRDGAKHTDAAHGRNTPTGLKKRACRASGRAGAAKRNTP